MSDVYSFGVVLLELLTGRRSVDKSRPNREQNLTDWARPQLNDSRKLGRIMDPRLEGQYSEAGAQKAAALAYQCLSHRPKQRPTMSSVVKTLELLQDYTEIPAGTFVYTAPNENDLHKEDTKEGGEAKKDSGHQGHSQRTRSPKSRTLYSANSPLHPKVRAR